jgi:hypothetical protein
MGPRQIIASSLATKKPIGFAVAALRPALDAHHHGLTGAINIGVEQSHAGPFGGQGQGQVNGRGAFAHATFARRHSDDVFHLRQQLHAALRRMGHDAAAQMHRHLAHAGDLLDGCDQLLAQSGKQAFGGVTQFHLDRHVCAIDAQGFEGFAGDKVLSGVGIHHGADCFAQGGIVQGHGYLLAKRQSLPKPHPRPGPAHAFPHKARASA